MGKQENDFVFAGFTCMVDVVVGVVGVEWLVWFVVSVVFVFVVVFLFVVVWSVWLRVAVVVCVGVALLLCPYTGVLGVGQATVLVVVHWILI